MGLTKMLHDIADTIEARLNFGDPLSEEDIESLVRALRAMTVPIFALEMTAAVMVGAP